MHWYNTKYNVNDNTILDGNTTSNFNYKANTIVKANPYANTK